MSASAVRLKHFGWGREGEGLNADEEAFVLARAEARFGMALTESASAHETVLVPLLGALLLREAVALAAEISGAPRNLLYARALSLKGAAPSQNGAAP